MSSAGDMMPPDSKTLIMLMGNCLGATDIITILDCCIIILVNLIQYTIDLGNRLSCLLAIFSIARIGILALAIIHHSVPRRT